MDYYSPNSLSAALYDIVENVLRPLEPEVTFYKRLAARVATPILEIGSGTARLALPLAEAGHRIYALEQAAEMIKVAEKKLRAAAPDVRERLYLVQGDMRCFDLRTTFNLVIVPFRTFNFLLTPSDQGAFFSCLNRHLAIDGTAVIDTWCPPGPPGLQPDASASTLTIVLGDTNHRIVLSRSRDVIDLEAQTAEGETKYAITTPDGAILRQQTEVLRMRWTDPSEMHDVIRQHGFRVEAELGGLDGGAALDESDRIWIIQRDA